MKINWKKDEITKTEASKILAHAMECLDYVSKTLPNGERPLYLWSTALIRAVDCVNDLQHWLKEK